MKKVTRTKNPSITQATNMALNLKEKFNRTFAVLIGSWTSPDFVSYVKYQISMLPGLGNASCTIFDFNSWNELLSWYLKVMEEGLPSE